MEFKVFNFSDVRRLNEYRNLKYKVFVKEFGWLLKVDENNRDLVIDKYDMTSIFFGAFESDDMVGTCRCSFPNEAYPYRNLLAPCIYSGQFKPSEQAVLTSYAFLRGFRGKMKTKNRGTYAESLFVFIVIYLKYIGIKRLLLSAGVGGSEKAFSQWGFKLVSGDIILKDAPTKVRNYAYEIR